MKALALDIKREEWESISGLKLLTVENPALDESGNIEDSGQVIIKPVYSGFCGSDKSIWFGMRSRKRFSILWKAVASPGASAAMNCWVR